MKHYLVRRAQLLLNDGRAFEARCAITPACRECNEALRLKGEDVPPCEDCGLGKFRQLYYQQAGMLAGLGG